MFLSSGPQNPLSEQYVTMKNGRVMSASEEFQLVDEFKVVGDIYLDSVRWGWGDWGKFLEGVKFGINPERHP